jgi:hypothetical protein
VQRVTDVVLVEDHLVAPKPTAPRELGERGEPVVVHVREERAPSQAVDSKTVIGHA